MPLINCNLRWQTLRTYYYRAVKIIVSEPTNIYYGVIYSPIIGDQPCYAYYEDETVAAAEAEAYVDEQLALPPSELEASVQVLIESANPQIEYASVDVLRDGQLMHGECWSDLMTDEGQPLCAHPAAVAPTAIGYTVRFTPPSGTHTYRARAYVRNAAGAAKEVFSEKITL